MGEQEWQETKIEYYAEFGELSFPVVSRKHTDNARSRCGLY